MSEPEDLASVPTLDPAEPSLALAIRDYNAEWAKLFSQAVEKKKGESVDLASEMFLRPAALNLRKLLRGERFGDLKTVKDSTVLAAINTILDRSHPKKAETEPVPRSFTQVNMTVYVTPGHTTGGSVPKEVHIVDVSPDKTRQENP